VFEFIAPEVLAALFQVVLIDLVLAGDNAIVIGLAAAGLPEAQRGKAILIGIVAATVLRILFAGLTTQNSNHPATLVQCSCSESVQWASGTIQSHRDRPGKMLMLRDSSDRSAANVSTT
jgi:hypothetical protein